jgi:hypothetical protein
MSETPDRDGRSPPRTGRGLRIALALSLSLNLLILGLVGGAALSRSGQDERPALRALGLGPFALALPRDARADMRDRIGEDAVRLRAERARIAASLRTVQRALLADPFDRDAAERALARSRAAALALQSGGHEALLRTLEDLPAEERARAAERLGRIIRRASPRGEAPSR